MIMADKKQQNYLPDAQQSRDATQMSETIKNIQQQSITKAPQSTSLFLVFFLKS